MHWRPAAGLIGDVHPVWADEQYQLIYLNASSPGQGQTYDSVRAVSADAVRWAPAPLAHVPTYHGTDHPQPPPYFVLDAMPLNGSFLSYTCFGAAEAGVTECASMSADFARWSAAPSSFAAALPTNTKVYRQQRDPFVFWDAAARQFVVVFTFVRQDSGAGGVGWVASVDLRSWSPLAELVKTAPRDGVNGVPECPQQIFAGGRWHVIASVNYNSVGNPSYWSADSRSGPYTCTPSGTLDGGSFKAGRVFADRHGDLAALAWVPLLGGSWGGDLTLTRKVVVLPEGGLGMQLHPAVDVELRREPVVSNGSDATTQSGDWRRVTAGWQVVGGGYNWILTTPRLPGAASVAVSLALRGSVGFVGAVLAGADSAIEIGLDVQEQLLYIQTRGGERHAQCPCAVSHATGDDDVRHGAHATASDLLVILDADLVEAFFSSGGCSLVARLPAKLTDVVAGLFAYEVRFQASLASTCRPVQVAFLRSSLSNCVASRLWVARLLT